MPNNVPFWWYSIIDFRLSQSSSLTKAKSPVYFRILEHSINVPEGAINSVVSWLASLVSDKVGNQAAFAILNEVL